MEVDVVVIGGGVIGLACAAESAGNGFSTLLIERHESFGQETSSRNSEVIHSGIYYPTGSLKAQLCVRANKNLYGQCAKTNVWTRRCGKLIVAVTPEELHALEKLYQTGLANGVEGMQILDQQQVKKLEPYINSQAAIFLPSTGIVDSHELMKSYLNEAKAHDANFGFGVEYKSVDVKKGSYKLYMKDTNGATVDVASRFVINAAGLQSDKVAQSFGIDIDEAGYKLHRNRGHYYTVSPSKSKFVSHLVYPLPHPHLVTVGIHITIDRGGQCKLGPDTDYLDSSIPERDWYKFDDSRKEIFFNAVHRYFPYLELTDLSPGQVGVRPKLVGSEESIKDFIVHEESDKGLPGIVNLIGIESPGLTCAREIAKEVFKLI